MADAAAPVMSTATGIATMARMRMIAPATTSSYAGGIVRPSEWAGDGAKL